MSAKLFKIGDVIECSIKNKVVVGKIVKINKTTYKLESGELVKFKDASEVNMDYWDAIVKNRLKNSMSLSLRGVDYTNFPFESVKNAFISLFGEEHYELLMGGIRKQIGL